MSHNTNPTVSNILYGTGVGTASSNAFVDVFETRDPTPQDVNYPIQKRWINTVAKDEWILLSFTNASGILQANWQLIGISGVVAETLTGNTGGAVGVDGANNINVIGNGTTTNVVGNPATHTLTISAGPAGYPITPYVVGPVGQAGYQTIQAAINAAHAAGSGLVAIQPGTYTENLTLYDKVDLWGAVGVADTGIAKIIGTHTPPTSGGVTVRNLFLQSSTNIFNSSAAGNSNIILIDVAISVINGYTFNLPNWTSAGGFVGFNVGEIGSTNDGWVNNTGGATVFMTNITMGAGSANTMITSGFTEIYDCVVQCPVIFITGSSVLVDGASLFTNTVTLANNSTGSINNSSISSGSSAAITMSSSANWIVSSCTINSTNNPSIAGSGAGSLTISDVTFLNNSIIANTLTLTITGGWYPPGNVSTAGSVLTSNGPGVVPTFQSTRSDFSRINNQVFTSSGTYTPTAGMLYCQIQCLGGGGAGGGAPACGGGDVSVGAPGSAGEYAVGIFSAATIGVSQTVTIGAAGAAVLGANGGNGGNTSVGLLISAFGGLGGSASTAGISAGVSGPAGGTGGAGGDYRTPGMTSNMRSFGNTASAIVEGGGGANSQLGSGGRATGSPEAGNNASGYGAAGSGCANTPGGAALIGGNGVPGIVIITEYIG